MSTKILSNDIELRAAERMGDVSDSGGEMSGVIIESNAINQLFSPISESDRVTGRVSLREAYLHINTADDSVYRGANVIIDKAPTDPNVEVLLFGIGQQGAFRSDAQNYVESYISQGSSARFVPLGTQNSGQQQLLAYQKESAPIPEIGDVYIIKDETSGNSQAFKIKDIEYYQDTFGIGELEFTCNVLKIDITQPLSITFPGQEPNKLYINQSWIRYTVTSQNANYYGISKLTTAAVATDSELVVDTILKQLVPVTTSIKQLVDNKPIVSEITLDAGSHEVTTANFGHTKSVPITISNRSTTYSAILRPIPAPGSLTISYSAMGRWYTLTADIDGNITGDSTSYGSGQLLESGTASITLGTEPDIDSSIIWSWGTLAHYAQRLDIEITPPLIYIELGESVSEATLEIDYLKANVVVTASADAQGIITDTISPSNISGTIDKTTGSIEISFIVMPDVGSSMSIRYEHSTLQTEIFAVDNIGALTLTLGTTESIVPGSVKLEIPYSLTPYYIVAQKYYDYNWDDATSSWIQVGISPLYARGTLLITDNGSNNIGLMGTVEYVTVPPGGNPEISLTSTTLSLPITILVYIYNTYPYLEWRLRNTGAIFNAALSVKVTYEITGATGTNRTATVAVPSIVFKFGSDLLGDVLVPGALRFEWNDVSYRDYGNGSIYSHAMPWTTQTGNLVGSVNYETRTVTLNDYTPGTGGVNVISCLTKYGDWSATDQFGRTPGNPMVPQSFQVRVTDVQGNEIIGLSDQNGVINGYDTATNPTFMPIQGTINQDMGIYELHFGQLVVWDDLTADERLESWYTENDYGINNKINYALSTELKTAWWYERFPTDYDGYIWKPLPVINNTLLFNLSIINPIPLSPAELGLDPVKLPTTGKVPIFKPGTRVTIHNTQSVTLPDPAVAGSIIDCGRERLARVRIIDALGRRVPDDRIYPGQYVLYSGLTPEQQALYQWWEIRNDGTVWLPSSTDLDAGLVELSSPLDLTGYDQPLKIEHTIEDSALTTSVDLSGYIQLNYGITHDYPANTSWVSSQFYYGDMYARYTNLFSQVTWTGDWSDTLIGSTTAAQYNSTVYPVIVTNDGIIDERLRITFTSNTAFACYGERSGLIGIGDINTDFEPSNPIAVGSYLFIDHRGWGGGWAIGNTVRLNLLWPGAIWASRCVIPGPATGTADTVGLTFRGDSDPA